MEIYKKPGLFTFFTILFEDCTETFQNSIPTNRMGYNGRMGTNGHLRVFLSCLF